MLLSLPVRGERPHPNRIADLDKLTGGLLGRLAKSGELTGKTLELTLVHAPAGLKSARLLLVGQGSASYLTCNAAKSCGCGAALLKTRGVHKFVFALAKAISPKKPPKRSRKGPFAADFESDKYKTDKKNDKFIEALSIAGYGDAQKAVGERGIARGRFVGDSQNFTRDLVNEPSNKLTPRIPGEKAEAWPRKPA